METPSKPIGFVPAGVGETFFINGIKCRIQEDGSRTDNRIGCAEFTLPPKTRGPPAHWHEMHDEVFYVTKGQIRFYAKDDKHEDAKAGDVVIVPPRAPHTFENLSDEEAVFFNTFTPAFYVQYFKLMHDWTEKGTALNPENVRKAMAYFATIGVDGAL